MNEIRGTFNIGGTWSETFENETEFIYCMDKIQKNPCCAIQKIIFDNNTVVTRVKNYGDGNYAIWHAPNYILTYFYNHGLLY